jgi:hypothetical protein
LSYQPALLDTRADTHAAGSLLFQLLETPRRCSPDTSTPTTDINSTTTTTTTITTTTEAGVVKDNVAAAATDVKSKGVRTVSPCRTSLFLLNQRLCLNYQPAQLGTRAYTLAAESLLVEQARLTAARAPISAIKPDKEMEFNKLLYTFAASDAALTASGRRLAARRRACDSVYSTDASVDSAGKSPMCGYTAYISLDV